MTYQNDREVDPDVILMTEIQKGASLCDLILVTYLNKDFYMLKTKFKVLNLHNKPGKILVNRDSKDRDLWLR